MKICQPDPRKVDVSKVLTPGFEACWPRQCARQYELVTERFMFANTPFPMLLGMASLAGPLATGGDLSNPPCAAQLPQEFGSINPSPRAIRSFVAMAPRSLPG